MLAFIIQVVEGLEIEETAPSTGELYVRLYYTLSFTSIGNIKAVSIPIKAIIKSVLSIQFIFYGLDTPLS